MQAIIIAGGKGTRLKSFTKGKLPKVLVPLLHQTLLDYIIKYLKKNGCDDIIICAGYLGNKIKKHIEQNDFGVPIKFSKEKKELGTAGGLHLIKNFLKEEFFILFGDIYTEINLKKMLAFHKLKKADITLALHRSDHPQDSTIVRINKNKKLTKFIEKPGDNWKKHGNLTKTSLYIVKKDVLKFIPRDAKIDFAKDVFSEMLKERKKLFGYVTKEFAKDIGTPERYKKVLNKLRP